MADEEVDYTLKQHQLYLDERKQLVDAARESSRTFDKAVLTFGAAAFGASIAFLKDIAPHPAPDTLTWLGAAWLFFSLGLLSILLSFLFSHRACLFEIDCATKEVIISGQPQKKNPWSTITTWCNFLCIVLLFLGLLCWSRFAFDKNLGSETTGLPSDTVILPYNMIVGVTQGDWYAPAEMYRSWAVQQPWTQQSRTKPVPAWLHDLPYIQNTCAHGCSIEGVSDQTYAQAALQWQQSQKALDAIPKSCWPRTIPALSSPTSPGTPRT